MSTHRRTAAAHKLHDAPTKPDGTEEGFDDLEDTEITQELSLDADEPADSASSLPEELVTTPKEPSQTTRAGRDDEHGDSMLGKYFRAMASYDMMTAEEELAIAREVEATEVAHWQALLSFLPAARILLPRLAADVQTASDDARPATPQIERLEKLAKGKKKLASPEQKRWTELVDELAKAIRLPDSDRVWMANALATARKLGGVTELDDDESGPRSTLVVLPGTSKWLARVDRTFAEQLAVKTRFVSANLRLVVSVARRYNRGRMPLIDLIQEGNIGLMKAVERFDHLRGYRFSTYASWWIRHAISRALADKGRAVRIPVHMLDTYNRVTRATHALVARTGRSPTLEELELETGIPCEKLERVKDFHAETPFSLDRPVGDEDGRRFIDFLTDDDALSPFDHLANQNWGEEIKRLFGFLSPIEVCIIKWRFGLGNTDELTLKEIGDKYDLSRERIRQLQEQALLKMRKHLRE